MFKAVDRYTGEIFAVKKYEECDDYSQKSRRVREAILLGGVSHVRIALRTISPALINNPGAHRQVPRF